MGESVRVVHYLNQFFAGLGGEDKANLPVQVREGSVGPGRLLQRELGERGTVVATIVAGDNYLNEQRDEALPAVRQILEELRPDVVVGGPAFDAGRYGLACGEVAKLSESLGIPAITAMHPENPGVIAFRRETVILPTGSNPTEMGAIMASLARLAVKLASGVELGPADEDGYIPRGFRRPGLRDRPAAERAIDMLVTKATGKPFRTELPIELPEVVEPAPPIRQLRGARLALVTTGGLVPRGNPDRLVRGNAKVWLKYSLADLGALDSQDWECVHRGFYTTIVNANPNYILPLDTVRDLQSGGVFADLYPWFFSTSGVGTAVGDARRMGREMAAELRQARVDGVLLVAT